MSRNLQFGHWSFHPDAGVLVNATGDQLSLEPRVARLLEYFLANDGQVLRHDQLIDAVWEGRVVSDEAVRRGVSNLRQALVECGLRNCIRTVHKKGYVASFPAPLPTTPPSRVQALRRDPRMPLLAASILLLLIWALAVTWWIRHSMVDAPDPAGEFPIAVLPFADLGPETESYFAEGLAEELLGLLSRQPGFRVTSRGSSFRFHSSESDPREIGELLGVRYLLDGSVRHHGGKMRVAVQLVDAQDGYQLWSERYDRDFTDLLRVQEDIARKVARELRVVLVSNPLDRHPSALGEGAYRDYLRARQLIASGKTDELEAAIRLLQDVKATQPEFAPAWASLAEAMVLNMRNQGTDRFESTAAAVRPLLERALALDPKLGEAYITRARLTRNDPEARLADLQRGLSLNPSHAVGHEQLAELYHLQLHQPERALEAIDRARALNPLQARNHYAKAYLMMENCDIRQARELAQHSLELDSDYLPAAFLLGQLDAMQGNVARAHRQLTTSLASDPRNQWLRNAVIVNHLNLADLAGARRLNEPEITISQLYILRFTGELEAMGERLYSANSGELMYLSRFSHAEFAFAHASATGDPAPAREFLARQQDFHGSLPTDIPPPKLPETLVKLLAWHGPDPTTDARQEIAHLRNRLQQHLRRTPSCRSTNTLALALAAATLGENDQVLEVLESAIRREAVAPWLWWWMRSIPAFAALEGEPRYQALLAQLQSRVKTQQALLESYSSPDTGAESLATTDATHPVDPAGDHTGVGLHWNETAQIQ